MLFERGKFDAAATGQASSVLIFFLVGSFAFAANTIVPRAYYATQDTLFPAIYGSLAVILSIPLYLLGLKMLGTRGIALAASLSAVFQVLILYILWNRRSGNSDSRIEAGSTVWINSEMNAFIDLIPYADVLYRFILKSDVLPPGNLDALAGDVSRLFRTEEGDHPGHFLRFSGSS